MVAAGARGGDVGAVGDQGGTTIARGLRNSTPADLDRVFETARRHGKAVEINSSPERMDLPDVHAAAMSAANTAMAAAIGRLFKRV